jgi:hypothetical protein
MRVVLKPKYLLNVVGQYYRLLLSTGHPNLCAWAIFLSRLNPISTAYLQISVSHQPLNVVHKKMDVRPYQLFYCGKMSLTPQVIQAEKSISLCGFGWFCGFIIPPSVGDNHRKTPQEPCVSKWDARCT